MGFFSLKSKEELVAIFDVGSASVGGALVLVNTSPQKNKTAPKVLYATRSKFVFQDDFNFNHFLFSMLQTFEVVAKDLEKQKLGAPKRIHCFLASPWYASQTRIARFQKNTPFIFTKKLWNELVEKEVTAFSANELQAHANKEDTPRVIEKKTMHLTLNGYEIADPVDKKASELELSIFMSISPEKILKSIEDIVWHFSHAPVFFSSFLFASFVGVRDAFAGERDYLIVDVAGEMTDIGLVKNNILSESASFPRGKNFVIRKVASGLKRSGPDTLSLINLTISGTIDEGTKPKVEALLSKARAEWLSSFQRTLANISSALSLPSTIFLTGDDDMVAWFLDVIKTEEFTQYTLTEKQFNVILVGKESLHPYVLLQDSLYRDSFLMLESIFINRMKF